MIVCHCKRVQSSTIETVIAAGAACSEDVSNLCGAGTRCGSCLSTIDALLEAALATRVSPAATPAAA